MFQCHSPRGGGGSRPENDAISGFAGRVKKIAGIGETDATIGERGAIARQGVAHGFATVPFAAMQSSVAPACTDMATAIAGAEPQADASINVAANRNPTESQPLIAGSWP